MNATGCSTLRPFAGKIAVHRNETQLPLFTSTLFPRSSILFPLLSCLFFLCFVFLVSLPFPSSRCEKLWDVLLEQYWTFCRWLLSSLCSFLSFFFSFYLSIFLFHALSFSPSFSYAVAFSNCTLLLSSLSAFIWNESVSRSSFTKVSARFCPNTTIPLIS